MEVQLLDTLSSLEAKLNNLLTSITSSPTASGAPAAAAALLNADDALTNALQTLRIHQSNHAKILRLRSEAQDLEERVKGIVREVMTLGEEISTTCHGDRSDSESEAEGEDTQMGGVAEEGGNRKSKNEVDYKLLLNFARRISRYNTEAAADASAGMPVKSSQSPTGEGNMDKAQEGGEASESALQQAQSGVGVAALSKEAVSWLDETANWSRDASQLPYPSEDHIRMGLMGHLQAASVDGKDPEKEAERMVLAAEGGGDVTVSQGAEGMVTGVAEGGSASDTGHTAIDTVQGHGPRRSVAEAVKPKSMLDLDLYDPDEDDD
ncbi:hypothetical protein AJ80_02367 [Polytolypa hystricis UAMH7299]|uniref:Mediator of RNA polymerase II transcription subunit 4 n=1 Tax=Polytolypa hystricis (strain UAMH7299) TaxID=1447883 RepID=A0A2B7YSJ2_POLH7|nr:hypothetical protein AJ80_02367 [Polytolypa hystricis UAMH7299]